MATDQVGQVKEKNDIVEIIGEKVVLKKAGRHFKGLCPFHSEKTPSFVVSPERQSFKCFGCGEGGDVFSFLQKYEGMSFLESLEALAKRVGITLDSYRPTSQDAAKKHLVTALDLAAEYYHFLLTKHASGQEAREYLRERGITNEAVQQFRLGWSPNSWRSVSEYLILKKGYREAELEAAGMMIKSEGGSYYDRFRGRIMFPLRDHRGVVVGFSGRTLSKDVKEAKYINSPETSLYSKSKMLYGLWENREYIRKEDRLILMEGELDVIPSWQAGVKAAAAIKGSAFTEEQARLIGRYTKNVAMALDADEAGKEAIKRAVNIADNLDMSIRVVQVKGGKDPGDVAIKDAKNWREMVKGATLYWDFLIEDAKEKYDPESGSGTKAISQELVPAIAAISNLVVRAHYVGELAKLLRVPEESIYEEIERQRKKKELSGLKEAVKRIEKGETLSRKEKIEEYLLSIALQYYTKIRETLSGLQEEWFTTRAVAKIVEALKIWPDKELQISRFAATLPQELHFMLDQAYLRDLTMIEQIEKEWEKIVKEVEELYLKNRLTELAKEIAKTEGGGQEKAFAQLQEDFARLSHRMSQIAK